MPKLPTERISEITMTLLLSRSDLEKLIDVPATLLAIEAAFTQLGSQPPRAVQPPVFVVNEGSADDSPDDGAPKFLVLAALSHDLGVTGTKTFADVPGNSARGLPSQRSLISLFSAETGEPLAVLDGRVPTRERTAATTAVATKYLARPESRVLGLIGAGGLAAPHVRAIAAVRALDEVRVWSRSPERVEQLRAQLSDLDLRFTSCAAPADVARTADIVCTLTPSATPVVSHDWFEPGTHVNAVGARPRPTHREIDTGTVVRSRVIVDDRSAALQKSGDILIPLAEGAITESHIGPTLAEVVAGVALGRTNADELTLFNSVGTGIQDLAIGTLYYYQAVERGLGTRIDFSE